MTQRIINRLNTCRAEGRAAFITYTMAGDPDFDTSVTILKALPKHGVDIIELGIPFTDPMADGPAIQRAGLLRSSWAANSQENIACCSTLSGRRFHHSDHSNGLL